MLPLNVLHLLDYLCSMVIHLKKFKFMPISTEIGPAVLDKMSKML
jgi:hypothetical protein